MIKGIKLSYVLTTFNKLNYLRVVINHLIENCRPDEEIIVIDANSSDGTKEFLNSYFVTGKIHQFISEKDFGEAHGFNKGLLLANGEIIKFITDDDVFDYNIIQRCKNYLLDNKSVDVLFANICSINATKTENNLQLLKSYEEWFKKWMIGESKNCFICGLSFIIRKDAIPYVGLFDTSYKHIDLEYSIRLTSKKVNVAFYTGLMVGAIVNIDSISHTDNGIAGDEIRRVSDYYCYVYPVGPKQIKDVQHKNYFGRLKSRFKFEKKSYNESYPEYNYVIEKRLDISNFDSLYKQLQNIIKEHNENNRAEFIENLKY